jgi:hypothetical protein
MFQLIFQQIDLMFLSILGKILIKIEIRYLYKIWMNLGKILIIIH